MAGGISVTITAVDKLTGTLDKINKKATSFGAPFKTAQASIAKFGEVSGLNRVGKAFGDIAYGARDAFGKVSQIVAPLGVISGAASVAGMYRLISTWSEWGSQLGFAAQNMNVAAGTLSNFQGAARLAGSSTGSLTGGLQTLGQTMFDAIGGRAPEAVVMFNTLGIAFRDANGHARNVADVMPEVADKIASIKDPFVQAKIATELFGGAGADLLPFLRKGSAGIRELQAETAKYNPVTQRSIDAANQFRMAQIRLTMSVEGLGNRISTGLAPIIAPLLTQLADWIATSPQVQRGIDALGQGVREFASYLKSIDWDNVERRMEDWGGWIKWVVGLLGGPAAVVRDLMVLMVGGFALKVIAPWARLGWSIGLATTRLGAYLLKSREVATAEAASGAASGVGGRFATIARLAGSAFVGEQLVGAADPNDRAGSWIDRHIPGAAFIDNAASHIGLGRSYEQQRQADPTSRAGLSGTAAARPSSAEQAKLAQQAVAAFVKDGWTPAQAAGIAAQGMQESGFNPRAVGDNGAAIGAFQWHKDRQRAIEQHFGKGIARMSLPEQYEAKNWELRQGGEQRAGRLLAMTTTAGEAGSVESIYDERPADRDGEARRRGGMADRIASAFTSAVTAQGAALQAPSVATANGAGDGTMTVQLEHANQPPAGFKASVTKTSGSLAGAQVAQANVTATLP